MAHHAVVTALERQRRRASNRINVFVDGRYAFSLEQELAVELRIGQPLSQLHTSELQRSDERARTFQAALAFLAHRPRSEREVRQRLLRRELPEPVVDHTLERLRRLKLLDDQAFARYWVEQRQQHRPRGPRLLRQELQLKGVAVEPLALAVQEAAELEDPVQAACRAGEKRVRALRALEPPDLERRLGQFLLRRGFDYATARAACRILLGSDQFTRTADTPGG